MGKLMQPKLRSATLIETIVALVIIVAVTGLTVMVFVQVTTSGYSIRQTRAGGLIEKYVSETQQQRTFVDEEFQEEEFVIRKQILPHAYSKELVWVKISILDRENKPLKHQNMFLLLK